MNDLIEMAKLNQLSPIEKFKKFGIFPFQLLVDVFISLFATIQILIILYKENSFSSQIEKTIYNYIVSLDSNDDGSVSRNEYFFTSNEVKERVLSSIGKFNEYIHNETLLHVNNASNQLIFVYKSNKDSEIIDFSKELSIFALEDKEFKSEIRELKSFTQIFYFEVHIPFFHSEEVSECYRIKVKRNFVNMNTYFQSHLSSDKDSCTVITKGNFMKYFLAKLIWVHLLVVILSIVSILHTLKYITRLSRVYMKAKKEKLQATFNMNDSESEYFNPMFNFKQKVVQKEREEDCSDDSSPSEKSKKDSSFSKSIDSFLEVETNLSLGWHIISLVSSTFLFLGAIICFSHTFKVHYYTEIFIGLGCFFSYINLGRYLIYSNDYRSIYYTVSYALPICFRYLIGVGALYIGFMIISIVILWKSENFSSMSNSFITLFAISQGDSILDIFNDCGFAGVLGQVFNYMFCIVFILIVMNLFIAILEEAYVMSQIKTESYWMNDFDKELKNLGKANKVVDEYEVKRSHEELKNEIMNLYCRIEDRVEDVKEVVKSTLSLKCKGILYEKCEEIEERLMRIKDDLS